MGRKFGGRSGDSRRAELNISNRLVYSAHDYGPHEYGQSWFNGSTTYASLANLWTKFWAYLSLQGTAPVWVGEFGTTNNQADISNSAAGSQGQWFQSLIAFLKANPNISWTYWALNGEDAYGLLDSQYDSTPANASKQGALASIQFKLGGTASCQSAPSSPGGLTATVVSASQINLGCTDAPPPAGCSSTYNLYASESPGFAISSANLVASGLSSTGYSATGLAASTTYYFAVTALDAAGQSAASPEKFATTQTGTAPPGPPFDLAAVATSTSAINLGWQASPTAGATYNVYRNQASGFTPSAASRVATGVKSLSYTNNGLAAGTAYYFLATAVTSNGESAASNQAEATTQSGSRGAACHIAYALNSQWNNGFNAAIAIQNTGSAAVFNWSLTWTWRGNQKLTQAWNSNLVQGGPNVVLINASWNGVIAPGASATGIGFNASYGGTNAPPAAFYLNGVMCR